MGNSQEESEFVDFRDIPDKIGMSAQYSVRYAGGFWGYRNLGEGLRFRNLDPGNHSGEIHRDDVEEFVCRLKELKGLK